MKQQMKALAMLLLLALLIPMSACSSNDKSSTSASSAGGDYTAQNESEPSSPNEYWDYATDSGVTAPEPQPSEGSVYQDENAKLIRRGEMSLETTEFDQSVTQLNELIAGMKGYYQNADVYRHSSGGNEYRSGSYVVRIPAEHFDPFLDQAGELAHLLYISQSSEDIGASYYDTEISLKTQRTKQERLLSLLEKAETMENIIALENALSETEYQIERLSSTLRSYDSLVGFATISIDLTEVIELDDQPGQTASLGQRMSAGFASSLKNLGKGAENFLIALSYNFFALLIFAGIVAVVAVVTFRKVKKKKSQPPETKQ